MCNPTERSVKRSHTPFNRVEISRNDNEAKGKWNFKIIEKVVFISNLENNYSNNINRIMFLFNL